jgi:peptidyl-prolyl cis-trans isomerase A (cyclophilin A)
VIRRSASLCAVAVATWAISACRPPAKETPAADSVADRTAPDTFLVAFQTNKGRIVVQAIRAWSPRGADRFYTLVADKFYDGAKFFRVLPNFMAQFGIAGDPAVNAKWSDRKIADDPVVRSNLRGFVSFATSGPDTRSTQLFINKRDNRRLDGMGFAPFAQVVDGMEVVDSLYMGYGEGAPQGAGPRQDLIQMQGNAYLNQSFPKLDSIITARVVRAVEK